MNVKIRKCLCLVGAAFAAPSANALDINAGDWVFSVNGYVNAHLVHVNCDDGGATVGGNSLLCTGNNASSVSNGYSPASFSFGVATNKGGYDIAATLAVEPGSTTNAAFNGNDDGEAYRAFFTFGNDNMGTITAGRAYGVFGIDVILEDMSLAGVGAPLLVKSPLNTSLGGAGYGYIFVDRLSQITYSAKSDSGISGALGIFQPLDLVTMGGANSFTGDSGSERPGLHGKLRYDFGSNGFVSTTFLSQQVDNAGGANYTATAFDLTGRMTFGGTSLSASGFKADGLGHSGLFFDAADSAGNPRESSGWFVQAAHTAGDTKYGINYGKTNLDMAAADTTTLLETQKKVTVGIYHSLVEGITMAVEASKLSAESHAGDELENTAVSVGVALAF